MVTAWSQAVIVAKTSGAELVIAAGAVVTALATTSAAIAAGVAARKAAESTAESAKLVQIETERFDEEKAERSKAELRPSIEQGHGNAYRLTVTNDGPGTAYNVRVHFYDPVSYTQDYPSMEDGLTEVTAGQLLAKRSVSVDTLTHSGGITVGFDVTWDDGVRKGTNYQSLLSAVRR